MSSSRAFLAVVTRVDNFESQEINLELSFVENSANRGAAVHDGRNVDFIVSLSPILDEKTSVFHYCVAFTM